MKQRFVVQSRLWRMIAGMILIIQSGLMAGVATAQHRDPLPCASPQRAFSLPIDGVLVKLCVGLSEAATVSIPANDRTMQVASIVDRSRGFEEVSITAIPYGMTASTEALPEANTESVKDYQKRLQSYRKEQGGLIQGRGVTQLFGNSTEGIFTIVPLAIDVTMLHEVALAEWVTAAGDRVWIIRYSRQLGNDQTKAEQLAQVRQTIHTIQIDSINLHQPSTSRAAQSQVPNPSAIPSPAQKAADLLSPSWWSGDCDKNNYPASFPLGGSYRGVKPCGPRPNFDTGALNPGRIVQFFDGALGEYEWQCVEFVMRYLYLAYQIPPYSANGSQVVSNYPGSRLTKVNNNTVGQVPQPGDILSFGATSSYGHTALVVETNVNSGGTGTITTLSQNIRGDGYVQLSVSGWNVGVGNSFGLPVSGWLHAPPSLVNHRWQIDYAPDGFGEWDTTHTNTGGSAAQPVPADYDGDGKADMAIKTASGNWQIDYAANGFGSWDFTGTHYGGIDALPVPADYDGDNKADLSVKTADGRWLIDYAANGFGGWNLQLPYYGGTEATPMPADYDGDGKADLSIKTSGGNWHIDYAANGFGGWDVTRTHYGGIEATPVPADYDGDGKADLSIKTSGGEWMIDYAANGFGGWNATYKEYGGIDAIPVPADYDGDGKADISVKTADGRWLIDYAANGFGGWNLKLPYYGGVEAYPVPADYDGDGKADLSIKVDY